MMVVVNGERCHGGERLCFVLHRQSSCPADAILWLALSALYCTFLLICHVGILYLATDRYASITGLCRLR